MKKKGIVLALVAAFCMAALTGCGGGSDSGEKLYLYNWTEYIPQEVYDAFEEETGIEVIESTFSSNEEMLAKLTAGGTGQYDMVVASNYVIKAMEEQGLIQELDKTQLENLGNISDAALGMNFDPENQYSIPFMGGITVIAYNTKMCEELGVTIEKFDDLLNPALENNMVVVDDVREIVGIALKAQGQDSNTTDQAVKMCIRDRRRPGHGRGHAGGRGLRRVRKRGRSRGEDREGGGHRRADPGERAALRGAVPAVPENLSGGEGAVPDVRICSKDMHRCKDAARV